MYINIDCIAEYPDFYGDMKKWPPKNVMNILQSLYTSNLPLND